MRAEFLGAHFSRKSSLDDVANMADFSEGNMAKTPVKAEATLIQAIQMRRIVLDIVGTSPFIMHRYARKAWQEMIYPKGKANTAERATSMKHNPIEEYRECFYRNRDDKSPTLFHLPDGMIKE